MDGQPNLRRMIKLAEDFFDVKNDQAQISVDEEVIKLLKSIHPSTLSEECDKDGPVAWVLIFPTTKLLMNRFLENKINERELLYRTPIGSSYEAIYLCSALVLPEYRKKGIARRLVVNAIRNIQREHPVEMLFVWGFSREGMELAESIAQEVGLPLYKKEYKQTC